MRRACPPLPSTRTPVAPGQTYQFVGEITGPASGTCDITLRMSDNGFQFGDTLRLTVTAVNPPNAAWDWVVYE